MQTLCMDAHAGSQNGPKTGRSIQEFWIDFLLEEEFYVDPDFASRFLDACGLDSGSLKVRGVVHSLTDQFGEADLAVFLSPEAGSPDSDRVVLLIEDKITAGFQPHQAERYQQRGEHGKTERLWADYRTVLVAPKAYLSNHYSHVSAGRPAFDIAIELETIRDWVCPNDQMRREFRQKRIDEAIAKKNATGVQIVDMKMTEFRTAYYNFRREFNDRHGTDFRIRPPGPTYWGDTWFTMKSDALPNWARIRHMAPNGNIEINFCNVDIGKSGELKQFLDADMALIATGKYKQHTTIRISIPKITSFDSFFSNCAVVEAAFLAAERLLKLYQSRRDRFDAILSEARTR